MPEPKAKHNPQQRALADLHSRGVQYALIREPSSWDDSGDLDIYVHDIGRCRPALNDLGFFPFSVNENNEKYLKYDERSGWWVHLDVHLSLDFGGIEIPSEYYDLLMRSSYIGSDEIRRLDELHSVTLLIFHATLAKNTFSESHLAKISSMGVDNLYELSPAYKFLPEPLSYYLKLVGDMIKGDTDVSATVRAIRRTFDIDLKNHVPIFNRVVNRLRSIFRGNQAVVFLGPDGAGKSTLVKALGGLRWPPLKLEYMGPSREPEMNKVFAFCLERLEGARDRFPKRTLTGSLVRAGWQFICYLDFVERLYRHVWFWGSGGLVIFDRYACDMYFRKPTIWNEILFLRLFPKPRMVFLCVGEASEIYRRKPEELTPKDIEDIISLYRRKLNQYRIPYLELHTTGFPPAELITRVVNELCEHNWYRE